MLIALDFETHGIESRPKYPPKPVGLALIRDMPDDAGRYYAWGHPVENNFKEDTACAIVDMLFANEENEFVLHNAPFDLSIIEEHWELEVPWGRVHDTMLMAFLLDPYGDLGLKPLAERYLNQPPEEQEAVRNWLIRKGIVNSNSKSWGAHIAKAPGKLVGQYAVGDVQRTLDLYKVFKHKLEMRGMI